MQTEWKPFTKIFPARQAPAGYLLNINDQFQMDAISKYGEYSDGEVELWNDILTPEDMVVEIGANMGVHTVPLALRAKEVVAFEPQRLMFQILTANVALNSLYNVYTVQAACGDRQDVIKVPVLDPYKKQSYGSLELDKGGQHGEDVVMMTLDSMGLDGCDFIKLDCEGCELKALQGAVKTIMKFRPWIYLEYTANREAILAFMARMGYICVRHLPEHIHKDNFNKAELIREDQYASDMLLCLPQDRKPRLSMLPPFGDRHGLVQPNLVDVLGTKQEIRLVEPYGNLNPATLAELTATAKG